MNFTENEVIVHFVTKEAIIEAGESGDVIAICGALWDKEQCLNSTVNCEECEELQENY